MPTGSASATGRANPRDGRWTVTVKLSAALRRSHAYSATLPLAGQTALDPPHCPGQPGTDADEGRQREWILVEIGPNRVHLPARSGEHALWLTSLETAAGKRYEFGFRGQPAGAP